MLTTHFLKGNK